MELTTAWVKRTKTEAKKAAPTAKRTMRATPLKVPNLRSRKDSDAQPCQADANGKNISSRTCPSGTGARTASSAGPTQNNPHKRKTDEDKDEEEKNSSMTTLAFDYAYLNENMHKVTEDVRG